MVEFLTAELVLFVADDIVLNKNNSLTESKCTGPTGLTVLVAVTSDQVSPWCSVPPCGSGSHLYLFQGPLQDILCTLSMWYSIDLEN